MNKVRLLLPLSVLICACLDASPVACKSDTLTNYIALGSMGCMNGGSLTFKDFGFTVVASSGSPTLAGSGDVNVTVAPPTTNEYGLKYGSSLFSVTSGQKVEYLLTYTIDPLPDIIHGFSLEMETNSPIAPGKASITSVECIGDAFNGVVCPNMMMTVTNMVSHNGITPMLMDVKQFGETNELGVRTTITLDASNGGTANFARFGGSAQTPEPANGMLVLAAVAGLWMASRRRCRAR